MRSQAHHPALTRPVNWDLIRQQYDQMIETPQ
jgi:hypothetical protein